MPARLSPPGTHTLLSSHPPRFFWGFPSPFLSSKACRGLDPCVAQTRIGFFPVGIFREHLVPLSVSRAGAGLQQNRVPELTKGRWEGHMLNITEKKKLILWRKKTKSSGKDTRNKRSAALPGSCCSLTHWVSQL